MATNQDFTDAIAEIRATNTVTLAPSFAELIVKVWAGKVVEVYIGDTYEDIKTEEISYKVPAVVIGKVITAYRECLVMDCAYIDQTTGTPKFGNIICLNERGIRHVTEVDGSGMLKDTFLNSKDGKLIKQLMISEKK